MTNSGSIAVLGSEFDDFLFAPIGDDRNDMPLSVLSALVRSDIDPWQEAAELAQLPVETAIQRLALLIAALPDWPSMHPDPGTIAARLIALLPRRSHSNIPARESLLSVGTAPNSRVVIYMIVINVIIAIFLIAASHQPPAQVESADAPATSEGSPEMPRPNSGQ